MKRTLCWVSNNRATRRTLALESVTVAFVSGTVFMIELHIWRQFPLCVAIASYFTWLVSLNFEVLCGAPQCWTGFSITSKYAWLYSFDCTPSILHFSAFIIIALNYITVIFLTEHLLGVNWQWWFDWETTGNWNQSWKDCRLIWLSREWDKQINFTSNFRVSFNYCNMTLIKVSSQASVVNYYDFCSGINLWMFFFVNISSHPYYV